MAIEGKFYEAGSSAAVPATLEIAPDGLVSVRVRDRRRSAHLSRVRVSQRIGTVARSIYFPDGGKFETLDNDAVDTGLTHLDAERQARLLHLLESRWRHVALALLIVAATVWWAVQSGIPLLAEQVACALPASVSRSMGAGVLEVLDRGVFGASRLDEPTRDRIRARFREITRGVESREDFDLLFRRGAGVGANAFALPSGVIVLTDELVALAENDDELVTVLAHEVGHVVHRHGLRRALQDSTVALLIVSITGDTAALSTAAASLPTLLVEAKYSRAFEREADRYALDYLLAHDLAPVHFANLVARLEAQPGGHRTLPNFLSTHPSTAERAAMFGSRGGGVNSRGS